MDERDYLIQQAIDQFNSQYGHKFTTDQFDIKSLPRRVNFDRSYEVYSTRFDDFLRMHMHLTFGDADGLNPFRLETDRTQSVNALGDEVYVAVGTVAKYHKDSGEFKFSYIGTDDSRLPIILGEDGTGLLLEDGGFVLLETATT